MDETEQSGDEGRLIRGRRTKLTLGLVGAAVLMVGALAAPRSGPAEQAAPAPAEPAVPLLQGVAQREVFRGLRALQEVGREGVRYTVSLAWPLDGRGSVVPGLAGPGLSPRPLPAVRIGPATLLANVASLADPGRPLSVAGANVTARVERCDPETGLALLGIAAGADAAAAPQRTDELAMGTAGIGVWLEGTSPVLTPVLVSAVDGGRVRLTLAELPPGTPVFDGEGRLALVAGRDGWAWTIAAALSRLEDQPRTIPAFLGLGVQAITEDLAPLVPGPGVLIADVEPRSPAHLAGVLPGDVLVAIGERDVRPAGAEAALASLVPGTPVHLRLRRGRQSIELDATPRGTCTLASAPENRAEGPRAESLFAPEALAALGIPGESIVLSIDGGAPSARRRRSRSPRLVRLQLPDQPPSFVAMPAGR